MLKRQQCFLSLSSFYGVCVNVTLFFLSHTFTVSSSVFIVASLASSSRIHTPPPPSLHLSITLLTAQKEFTSLCSFFSLFHPFSSTVHSSASISSLWLSPGSPSYVLSCLFIPPLVFEWCFDSLKLLPLPFRCTFNPAGTSYRYLRVRVCAPL